MQSLLVKADIFSTSDDFNRGKFLYRNLPEEIFEEISQHHNNVMQTSVKDEGGSRECPINGSLRGTFFSANVNNYTRQPPDSSPFGDTRLLVPVEYLVNEASNLYFADFYCLQNGHHYATLVLTESGTAADEECQRKLIKLDLSDNSFWSVDCQRGSFRVSRRCWVELFYTEDIDLNDARRRGAILEHGIDTIGSGFAYGGLRKTGCTICNI